MLCKGNPKHPHRVEACSLRKKVKEKLPDFSKENISGSKFPPCVRRLATANCLYYKHMPIKCQYIFLHLRNFFRISQSSDTECFERKSWRNQKEQLPDFSFLYQNVSLLFQIVICFRDSLFYVIRQKTQSQVVFRRKL